MSQRGTTWHMGSKGVAKVLHRTPGPMLFGLGVTTRRDPYDLMIFRRGP